MITSFRTVIHGRTIELPWDLGLPEGHVVEVTIKTRPDAESPPEAPLDLPTVETWRDRIIFDSAVSPTEKVVKGTGLLAEALVAELQEGKSEEELLQAHRELTSDDVAALRNYARWPVGLGSRLAPGWMRQKKWTSTWPGRVRIASSNAGRSRNEFPAGYGHLLRFQLDNGLTTPDLDFINGVTALTHGLTLVTHKSADYGNIPGLTFVDWLVP